MSKFERHPSALAVLRGGPMRCASLERSVMWPSPRAVSQLPGQCSESGGGSAALLRFRGGARGVWSASCSRMRAMTSGSVISAMGRRRPSQRGQRSGSTARVRRINRAQSSRGPSASSSPPTRRSRWRAVMTLKPSITSTAIPARVLAGSSALIATVVRRVGDCLVVTASVGTAPLAADLGQGAGWLPADAGVSRMLSRRRH